MSELINDIFERNDAEKKLETNRYKLALVEAKKEIDLADHLFFITYPAVNDLKMLIAIEGHIVSGAFEALFSLLEFLRQRKEISPFPRNNALMIDLFEKKVLKLLPKSFSIMDKQFISRLLELDHYIKNSNFQFKRSDSYILALADQSIKSINMDIVKHHLSFAKDLFAKVEKELKRESNI